MIFKRITKNSYRDHVGNIVSVIPFPLNRHFFFFRPFQEICTNFNISHLRINKKGMNFS